MGCNESTLSRILPLPGRTCSELAGHGYLGLLTLGCMMSNTALMLAPDVARLIHSVRDQRIILDADLAELYGVQTKVLNQAVKRNAFRFPADFLFRLTPAEAQALMRSQIVTASPGAPAIDPSKRNIR